MALFLLLDVGPDPLGLGVMLAVILFVIAFVLVLAGTLVLFLWYRKRGSYRGSSSTPGSPDGQPGWGGSVKEGVSSTSSAVGFSTDQSEPTISVQDFATSKRSQVRDSDRAEVPPHRSVA